MAYPETSYIWVDHDEILALGNVETLVRHVVSNGWGFRKPLSWGGL
jgi:hypothetical protein